MRPAPVMLLALAFAFAMATGGRLLAWQHSQRPDSNSVLGRLLGESRRAFAFHFFLKADAYFHQGYYPSVFDAPTTERTHLEETARTDANSARHEHTNTHVRARDWLEDFGNHFYPSTHRHLERLGEEREILPWLRLAAELDPHRVETYTTAAYWLRERLNRLPDAEAFLRDGLRANPTSAEILLELGRLYADNGRDVPRARAVLEMAATRWFQHEAKKPEPDVSTLARILGQLGDLEERAGNLAAAHAHFARLKPLSPTPDAIQRRLDNLQARLAKPR